MKRLKTIIRLMKLIHIVCMLVVIMFIGIALLFNLDEIQFGYDSPEFTSKITKISAGFAIGVFIAHIIPYLFFWRKLKRLSNSEKVKQYFTGSLLQWGLLVGLGFTLVLVFFIYPHAFIIGLFTALLVILLAKWPTMYRVLYKTKMGTNTVTPGVQQVEPALG